ncbi:MAG TPA: hypothetical protein VGC21_14455, partial [Telluria sp.]
MKNAFVIVTLSGLLSACAVAPQPQAPLELARIEPMPAAAPPGPQDEALDDEARDDPALPKVALNKDMLYRLMKAELDIQAGNWQAAYLSLMDAATQTRDPRLARRAAETALQGRQVRESMIAVHLWRELDPGAEEANQAYLALLLEGGDIQEAEAIFARRLALVGEAARPMAMYQAQQYLGRARDKAAAGAILDRLLAPYAASFEARVLLAQNAFAMGNNDAARKLAEGALALKPDSEIALLTLAQVLQVPAEQNALLAKFLAAHPQAREVRAAHARLLVSQKQYAEARRQFAVLLKQQPDNTATLYAIGLLAVELGDTAAAETYFTRYVEVFDRSAGEEPGKVLLMLSTLAEERKDFKAARHWAEQVSESDAEHYLGAQLRLAQ